MKNKIHTYKSHEPMLAVNAFIIEAEKEVVIVDATLTMSDSKALLQLAKSFNKPIAGILITHGHPDHIAGIANLSPNGQLPIYSLPSVKKLMEDTEEMKHQQWAAMFGDEWVSKWVYPNHMVKDNEVITLAGLTFKVLDIGSGGDCDANSIWLLEEDKVAFIGDFLYKENHAYMADGSVLRWLANLQKLETILHRYDTYYVGHGSECTFEDIAKQKKYFLTYCSEVLNATNGSGIFTDETRKIFESKMILLHPNYGCQFMVTLSADKVGKELINNNH